MPAAPPSSGAVGGVPLAHLNTYDARDRAYDVLAADGLVPPDTPRADRAAYIEAAGFYEIYIEPNPAITDAAEKALASIETRVQGFTILDLGLDGLSLASIYFLAAIGLAITALPFVLSPSGDLGHHLRSSLPRLLLHWVGPAWLVSAAWTERLLEATPAPLRD